MKLRSINIERFRAIQEMALRFEDAFGNVRPLTVIAGPNGSGKTSVLFAIVQALRGVMGYRTDDVPAPTDMDIWRRGNGNQLAVAPARIAVTLQLEFDPVEQAAIPKVLQLTEPPVDTDELGETARSRPPRRIPGPEDVPRGQVELEWRYPPERRADGTYRPAWQAYRIEPRDALLWFHARRRAIRGWLDGRLSKQPELLNQVGGIWMFPQDRNLGDRVLGTQSGQSPPGASPQRDDWETSLYEAGVELKPVWGILERISSVARAQPHSAPTERSLEAQLQDLFHRICAPKEYLGFRYPGGGPVGAPYFRDGDSEYPLNLAASGEQVVIEYITRLVYPTPLNYSLILIDEPEVHLHPGWIRKLYQDLPHIGLHNQFIVTTHSQELCALAAEDNCLVQLGALGE